MKKIIKHIILVILLVGLSINSNAYSGKKSQQSYNYDNITIIFNDTLLDESQQTNIAGTLVDNTTMQTSSSMGFICFFFGHDMQTGYVTAITHRVYSTPPRCLKETFEIRVCKRCGYFETELVGRCFIDCCP